MIKFKFNNPNSRTVTSIAIYRAPVGIDIPDEPEAPPLAILEGFATEFIDTTTVQGQDYNYRILVYKQGGEMAMSPTFVFGDVSLYGPGPYYDVKSGSDSIWDFGEVNAIEDLPTITELGTMAGPNCAIIAWNGKWRKFKVGSDIYFMPASSAISIANEDFEGFMTRAATERRIDRNEYSYELISTLSPLYSMAILDGRVPTTWSIDKEYPRVDALDPYSGRNSNASLIYAVSSPTAGQTLVQRPVPYSACSGANINMDTHQNFTWFWKPIFRFIPKVERNYT